MTDLIGKSLGRYHILEQLGEGGMAIVYKAYDTRLETDVAVKVIRTENILPSVLERSLKRFEREAKSLARLTHPNIVKVTDYGEFEGKPYLVMEYLPGGTLKDRIKQGQIPWQEAVRLILPIAQALEYAHEHNIIHRDVKPSNILLTEKGQPMLTDFGVAKLFDMDATADLTGTGMGVGTPEYMAPEQWQGHVSVQTDVYALGVVLYEMVTGRRPYTADTPAALLIKQTNDPLPRPKSFVPGLPNEVEKVILKALAKKIEDRYQTMAKIATAMEGLVEGKTVVEARSPRRVIQETVTVQEVISEPTTPIYEKSLPREKKPTRLFWLIGGSAIVLIAILAGLLKASPATLFSGITTVTFTPSGTSTLRATITNTPAQELATIVAATMQIYQTQAVTMTPTQTLIGTPAEEIKDSKGVAMHLVPEGEFTMGSEGGRNNERPIHQVNLGAYYMDKYEVTNALYQTCVSAGVCDPPHGTYIDILSRYYGNPTYYTYPVVNVDWYQANTYCEWRSARLPTEAEWEKAARGTDERIYPWGNESDGARANVCDKNCRLVGAEQSINDHYGLTAPVGSYERGKSPYGLYDMDGNVSEWVADWYSESYYQISLFENPLGPSSGEYRVIRGGSWMSNYFIRSSYRYGEHPDISYDSLGFRCTRSAP